MDPKRGIGLAIPVAFVVVGVLSQTFSELIDQISLFWDFFLVGLIAGLLIRAWWSVAVVPALLLATIVAVAIVRDELAAGDSSEIDSPIGWFMMLAFYLIFPSGIGTVIGAVVGSLIEPDEVY